jgi:transcriptional regulator with XRE-family HTH domain
VKKYPLPHHLGKDFFSKEDLWRVMKKNGLNEKQLAERTGYSVITIQHYKSDEYPISHNFVRILREEGLL